MGNNIRVCVVSICSLDYKLPGGKSSLLHLVLLVAPSKHVKCTSIPSELSPSRWNWIESHRGLQKCAHRPEVTIELQTHTSLHGSTGSGLREAPSIIRHFVLFISEEWERNSCLLGSWGSRKEITVWNRNEHASTLFVLSPEPWLQVTVCISSFKNGPSPEPHQCHTWSNTPLPTASPGW